MVKETPVSSLLLLPAVKLSFNKNLNLLGEKRADKWCGLSRKREENCRTCLVRTTALLLKLILVELLPQQQKPNCNWWEKAAREPLNMVEIKQKEKGGKKKKNLSFFLARIVEGFLNGIETCV